MSNKYLTCNDVFYNRTADLFKGFTQTQIAGMTGIAQSKIHDIIDCAQYPQKAQNKLPTIDIACKIAKAFDVTTDYLLGITDNKTTDKATQELCNTLGLSDTAIEILTGNPNSVLADHLRKVYTEDLKSEAEESGEDLAELVEGETLSVLELLSADVAEFFNAMMADYVQSIPSLIDDTMDYRKYPFIDLLNRFIQLSRSKDSSMQLNLNTDTNYLAQCLLRVGNNQEKPIVYWTSPKKLMLESAINDIVAKLHDIKIDSMKKMVREEE